MCIEVLETAESVAQKAAAIIAEEARNAVAARGRFVMAVSGGHTPWVMLRALATADVPWPNVHVVQVDERVAPAGHPDRNLTHLREPSRSRAAGARAEGPAPDDEAIPAGWIHRDRALLLVDEAAAEQLIAKNAKGA
jgi:6-phosphogluconolactonase/glucosamine-6-phosphate isomerase/deaminase